MGFEARVDEPYPNADISVETPDWSVPIAPPRARPGPVWFIDGVRRVELRVLADDGPCRAQGLFGSFAVGAVRCDGRAAFDEHRIGRALILGAGLPAARREVAAGGTVLRFEGISEPRADPDAPLLRLQDVMRDEENALAAHVVGGGAPLVIADGPLRLGEPIEGPIVGAVKRSVRRYLEATEDRLLGRLAAGERTPVFALLDRQSATRGYSWYTRVAALLGPYHDHAGVLRCEVRATIGLDAAVAMANRVSALLPAFAGRPSDPRTPQNLMPVAGLETWLRHRLGDARMIRRALLTDLMGEADDG
jgi:hypothetical protein